MRIVVIAAVARDGTIGHEGKIPWHISADLKRFKKLTMGHPIIMGRKTYESIGHPLPGRRNIVLTRRVSFPGVECYSTLEAALAACASPLPSEGEGQGEGAALPDTATIFIIGGAEIYRLALPVANTLHLTHIHRTVPGDTKFPQYDRTKWLEVSREDTPECSFVEYQRRG